MNTSKKLILIAVAIFLNSCIVKSLQPFYTKDSLSFNDKLIGQWTDDKNGQWTIESIKSKFEEDRKEGIEFSKEDQEFYKNYKNGCYINYLKQDKEAGFIAMPFKIENQYFLDFIPLEIEDEEINSLAAQHLLKTHSVTKLTINTDKELSFAWLSEERIKTLFGADKIRLKHEKIGPEETLLLTATSEELYTFLKKFMKSDIEDKWKKSDMITLNKSDAQH